MPDGSKGLPHFQTEGVQGHSFWGTIAIIAAIAGDALDAAAFAADMSDPTVILPAILLPNEGGDAQISEPDFIERMRKDSTEKVQEEIERRRKKEREDDSA